MYDLIRQELMYVVASSSTWAFQLCNSYDAISNISGFSVSDLAMLTSTLNQDLSDYGGPEVELMVSPVVNAEAPATQKTWFKLPTHDTLTHSGDYVGQIQRGISCILRARAYLDLFAFCRPSPPE
jgi:hypothetical protein